jgi:NADH dehydrogenase FAD-containing subunit
VAILIDPAARQVQLLKGAPLPYDYLVYAAGSGSGGTRVPGAGEFAYPIADLDQTRRLAAALAVLPEDAPVCVVGAGPTGIETAAELAEQGRAVTLVGGAILGPYLSRPARRSVAGRR